MSHPLDTDAGSELFASYENELKLMQADLNQKLDQIAEASGEQRKAAVRQAEAVLEEAMEQVSFCCFGPVLSFSRSRVQKLGEKKKQRPTNGPVPSSTKCAWKSRTSHPPPALK